MKPPLDITVFETLQEIRKTHKHADGLYQEFYFPLTQIVEAGDDMAKGHFGRVSTYARKVAEYLGMSASYCVDIECASAWHDVGKVGIPASILLARRKLTDDEFRLVQKHTTIGYDLLTKTSSPGMASEVAHFHHERYDGTGYPEGLKGEEIPLTARIVALVDVYDALRSWRPYKHPWSHEKAMRHIYAKNGTDFDPKVVQAFLTLEQELQSVPLMHYTYYY